MKLEFRNIYQGITHEVNIGQSESKKSQMRRDT